MRQLVELGHGAKGLDYDPNFADSSQVTAERGENEALVNKLAETLHDVEHALEKFANDTYGIVRDAAAGRSPPPAWRPSRKPGSALTAPPPPPTGDNRPPAFRPGAGRPHRAA